MGITIGSVIVSTYIVLILVMGTVISSSHDTSQNKVPVQKFNLTTVDFGFIGNNDKSPYINFDKSIIAQRIEYSSGNEENYLSYTIFQSDYSTLIKFYENRLLSKLNKYGSDLSEQSTNLPGNIVVYADSVKRIFVLVSEDKAVEIRKDFINISEEDFLNKVYKKLFY